MTTNTKRQGLLTIGLYAAERWCAVAILWHLLAFHPMPSADCRVPATPIRVYSPEGKLLGKSSANIFKGEPIDFTFNPRTSRGYLDPRLIEGTPPNELLFPLGGGGAK